MADPTTDNQKAVGRPDGEGNRDRGAPLPAHATAAEGVAVQFGSAAGGLSEAQAVRLRETWGFNELPEAPEASVWKRVARQFEGPVIWVLIAATVVAAASGEWADAAVILAIVLLNAAIGYFQEERAGRALAALRRLSAPQATVLREGVLRRLAARELVPGDRIRIEAGDEVPADGRLLGARSLTVGESRLTGESVPIGKDARAVLDAGTPLADRGNMVYGGTVVASGNAEAVIVATGPLTEFGRIAGLLGATQPEPTPLQRRLAELGRVLIVVCLGVVSIVFALELWRGGRLLDVFMTSVGLAVAAVPEGLPAVVTIALALGVQRMARRHALVRRLPSVETLGSVTVICTDKTGTLSCGEMTVREVVAGGEEFEVSGLGYVPDGQFTRRSSRDPVDATGVPGLRHVLTIAARCNRARVERDDRGNWQVVGDPTEGALVVAAMKAGIEVGDAPAFVAERPFDSDRKMMSVVVRESDGTRVMYAKGAPEVVLERCDRECPTADGTAAGILGPARRVEISEQATRMASSALRVLAVAHRPIADAAGADDPEERHLVFDGLIGMIDPPREEAEPLVRACRRAGIRPVMITGDHPDTAMAIARAVGILGDGDDGGSLTGAQLDALTDQDLEARVDTVSVYARVTAEHKLRIVRAWKARGQVVAMTGDGVNDAPAVEAADIGIAMGVAGTDVTRAAADMVLADDNFASIVGAVEEGRTIFDNIRKVVHYLLSCNAAEVLFMLVAALAGWPMPLTAIQLLWINLVTDGLPALALGVERAEPDVMSRPPRPPREPVLTARGGMAILWHATLIAAASAVAFSLALRQDPGNPARARTVAFCVVAGSELLYSLACRSIGHTFPRLGVLSNPALLAGVAVSAMLQMVVVVIPPVAGLFGSARLNGGDWAIVLGLSLAPVTVIEIGKLGSGTIRAGRARTARHSTA